MNRMLSFHFFALHCRRVVHELDLPVELFSCSWPDLTIVAEVLQSDVASMLFEQVCCVWFDCSGILNIYFSM